MPTMKPNRILLPWVCALLSVVAVPAKDIPLSKCPQAVQETIRRYSRGGKIEEVESLRIQGRQMFIAEVELAGDKDLKIYVLSSGTLVKTREEIKLDDSPATVQEATRKLVPPGGHVDDVTRTTESDGAQTYEVEIERPGTGDLTIVFSPDGVILSRKEKSKS